MFDDPELKIKVNTSDIVGASGALNQFSQTARQAGQSTRDHATEIDRLTRSVQTMIQQQRDTNQLLAQSVQVQRQSTQSIDDHISSMTRLTTAVGAASLAYNVFHTSATAGAAQQGQAIQQLTQNYQTLIGTLDTLAQKMAAIQQSTRPTGIPAVFGAIAPSAQGFGYGGAVGGEIYAAIMPAISQVLTPQLQQMYQAIQGQAARNSIDVATLLKGVSTGTQAGFGPEAGADMVTKMQHALNDLGQAAEFQRMTLHEYGITTKDANEALRQFVAALGKTQDSWAKTATISQFGMDPAMFTQTAAARLNPPAGSQAALQQKQQEDIARLTAQNAALVDQYNAAQVNRTRTFFGLLPAAGSILTGGQYTNTQYQRVGEGIQAGQQYAAGQIGQGNNILGNAGTVISDEWALLVNKLSSIVGAAPNYGAMPKPNELDQAKVPVTLTQELEEFNRSIGRFTPQAIQTQIAQTQRRGQAAVDALSPYPEAQAKAQKDLDDAMAFFTERLHRIGDPMQVFAEDLERQTRLFDLPANQRIQAGILTQREQQQYLSTGQRPSQADITNASTAISMQTDAEFKDHLKDLQHEADYQKQLAAAYAAGGADLQKVIAGEKEYQAAKKSGFDANQQAVTALQDMKNALVAMETEAQGVLLKGQQANVLSGNIAGAGGNPVAQRQAELRNQAMTQLHYFDRYNQAAGSGNYADIQTLNKELDQLTQTLGVDMANQAAAGRSSTLFQGQQQISGLTGALSGPGGDLQRQQAAIRARASLTASGAPFSEGDVGRLANQDLQKKTVESVVALTEEVEARKALLPFEQQHAAAIMAGVPAEKEFADNLKIAADIQKLMATATKDQIPLIEKLNKELTDQAAAERKLNQEADQARVIKNFQLGQEASGREISAYAAGGPNAMALQSAAEPYRKSLIDSGMDPDKAQAMALQMAEADRHAADLKTALTDASSEISTTMKSALSDVVGSLTDGIGKAHGLRYALLDAGKAISKLGLDMFVTKPLSTLMDNIGSGRGANFNVGNSGLSYTAALGQAFSAGIGKSLGFGSTDGTGPNKGTGMYSAQAPHGNDAVAAGDIGKGADAAISAFKSSSGEDSPSFLSSLFGGNSTAVGRFLNGTSDGTGRSSGTDSTSSAASPGSAALSAANSYGAPTDLTVGLHPAARRGAVAVASPGQDRTGSGLQGPAFGTPGFPMSGGDPRMPVGAEIMPPNTLGSGETYTFGQPGPGDYGNALYHSGGMVRKYHTGDGIDALASDEVPAILQTGERVLNRQETAAHDALFPDGILAAPSPGGVGRGAIGEYPLGRNDAINAGAGPIGEALLGMGAGAGVGLMRGALASGVMSDITGAMTNPLMRGAQPTLKLTEDLGDGLMRYGIHMGGEDPVATALIQHPPGGVGQAYIHNIRMTSSITGEANALGPRNLMGVMKQFRNDNPGVTGFGGARVSGARAGGIYGAGGGDVNLSFPSFPSFHRGGFVTRHGLPVFDAGGSVDVLDQILSDDDKRSVGNWVGGPNLGSGGTQSGIGPQVGKVTTDRTMDMISMVVGKLGGLKDLFGGGGGGGSATSAIGEDSMTAEIPNVSTMHRGGLVVRRFHEGGLAANEMPSILSMLAAHNPAHTQSPAQATGRSQPGNTVINQNIYTPDANSFRASADQTAAAAQRAQTRAARNV